jgi:hypothetical protein
VAAFGFSCFFGAKARNGTGKWSITNYPPGGINISARLRSRGGISPKLQDNHAHYSVTGGGGYKIFKLG